jgi:pimeloyl-ACP methyl ester carboxylesterase
MPFCEHDGNRLYYVDSADTGSPPGAPAIVFSHGAFLDHTMWEFVVADLAPSYRCLSWDERGHGMSEATSPFTYWDAAGDVMAILDAAGVDTAVLVGMSQGGWLTQRAALAEPDRVRGIVLTGTSLRLLSEEEQAGYSQLASAWLNFGPVGDIATTVLGLQFAPTDFDGSNYIDRWQSKPPGAWTEVWAAILGRDDIVERAAEVKCPVLVIHGTADRAFPVAAAEEMNSLLGDSRNVVVIDGAPHCIALTYPDEMSAAIGEFVAGLA